METNCSENKCKPDLGEGLVKLLIKHPLIFLIIKEDNIYSLLDDAGLIYTHIELSVFVGTFLKTRGLASAK